jgi:hypothetical protein
MTALANLWVRSGLLWVIFTMGFGLYLGLTGQFGASSPHAHAGILGGLWAFAFAFLLDRRGEDRAPARGALQWGLFNLGLVIQVFALWMVINHGGAWGAVVGLGGIMVLAATGWIAFTVWPRRGL